MFQSEIAAPTRLRPLARCHGSRRRITDQRAKDVALLKTCCRDGNVNCREGTLLAGRMRTSCPARSPGNELVVQKANDSGEMHHRSTRQDIPATSDNNNTHYR